MKKALLLAAGAMIAFAQPTPVDAAENETVPQSRIQTAGAFLIDPVTQQDLIGPATSGGALLRERSGVTFSGSFTGLAADNAYSMWWIIFNKPSNCNDVPCSVADLFAGAGHAFYAGGFIADDSGAADVTAKLPAGAIPDGAERFSDQPAGVFPVAVDPASEIGLRRPIDGDVRLIARRHGPADPTIIGQQIGTFLGGCDRAPDACADEQVVIFLPATGG